MKKQIQTVEFTHYGLTYYADCDVKLVEVNNETLYRLEVLSITSSLGEVLVDEPASIRVSAESAVIEDENRLNREWLLT